MADQRTMIHSNPVRPPGVRIMGQKDANSMPGLIDWAKQIINDSKTYPMFSESVRMFGDKMAMARVEYHNWSTKGQHGQSGDPNEKIPGLFRGATFYQIVDPDSYGTYQYNVQQATSGVSGDASEVGCEFGCHECSYSSEASGEEYESETLIRYAYNPRRS